MSSTIIDHAIAIPTKQRNVWEYVSDIAKFPLWREDIQTVVFLTGRQEGRGTRFRTTTKRGAEQVIEVTAWYEGLGYEYIIVDGSSFANNRGRVRLQESTEGTIVQWTFSYELTGFLSGLRNSLSVKRSIDNNITENLRNLYTYIKDIRGDEKFLAEDTKSYLQEAPDVLARAQYQPRYPTQVGGNPAASDTTSAPNHRIFEPPLAEDDTKPNPSIQETVDTNFKPLPQVEPLAGVEPLSEPTFLKNVPDLSKNPPQTQIKPEPLPRFDEPEPETEAVTAPTPASNDDSTSIWLPETDKQPTPTNSISEQSPDIASTPTLEDDEEADVVYTKPLPGLPDTTKLDTGQMSVFELFGLPKPSETENTRTIQETPPIDLSVEPPIIEANTSQIKAFTDVEPIVPDVEPEIMPKRTGLRASLRRKKTRVRLPK